MISPEVRDRDDIHYQISGVTIGIENDDDRSPQEKLRGKQQMELVNESINTLNNHGEVHHTHQVFPPTINSKRVETRDLAQLYTDDAIWFS